MKRLLPFPTSNDYLHTLMLPFPCHMTYRPIHAQESLFINKCALLEGILNHWSMIATCNELFIDWTTEMGFGDFSLYPFPLFIHKEGFHHKIN